jgi:recombinational DNA repair ATPase RecF
LFYGPNGAGKSSLCEAIERALLGTVEEGELKRLEEDAYLRNNHAGRFAEPSLTATGADRREVRVAANADRYRFCFIEKNRIDAFSRLAQRPQGQRAELIATLFGMEKFNDFCNRFNDQIDPALVIRRVKQTELQLARQALVGDRATADGEGARLTQHDAEDEAYAATFDAGASFARLREFIGSRERPGRLAELNDLIDPVPASIFGADRGGLVAAFDTADAAAGALATTRRELQRRAGQVAFRDLYAAVAELENESGGRCPACETPLERVANNPFDRARGGLNELRDLAELQDLQERQRNEATTASAELRATLAKLSQFVLSQEEADTPVGRYLLALPLQPEGLDWWAAVYAPEVDGEGGPAFLEHILAAADRSAAHDRTARAQRESRAHFVAERDDLIERQRHIDQRMLTRQRIIDDATAARARIATFDAANAILIAEAEQERVDIDRDAPIRAAYMAFLPCLRRFRDELPGLLIEGLGELARDLYNEFNRGDRDDDKLAHLYLPLTGDQRIQLAFRSAPGQAVDALQALSEGHIRCLGLAILLAKATSIDSPLLVFDDAVNAIDHDHRHGIKETLFAGNRFLETQILVTCHSPEFIKDVRNAIPRERRSDCREYVLTHHEGDHHPRVHRDVLSSAYIDKARRDLGRYQLRDALANSRRALEKLSNKAWKWLVSYELGELRLTMHGPASPLNLRDLCDAIRLKLHGSAAFNHPSKAPLLEALDEILSATNLTWKYLNGGTHEEEDRDEFDPVQVELVVSRLEHIDALDLRAQR